MYLIYIHKFVQFSQVLPEITRKKENVQLFVFIVKTS